MKFKQDFFCLKNRKYFVERDFQLMKCQEKSQELLITWWEIAVRKGHLSMIETFLVNQGHCSKILKVASKFTSYPYLRQEK